MTGTVIAAAVLAAVIGFAVRKMKTIVLKYKKVW